MPRPLPGVHRDQQIIFARADAQADAVEKVVHATWQGVLSVIARTQNYHALLTGLRHVLGPLYMRLVGELHGGLVGLSHETHKLTVQDLAVGLSDQQAAELVHRRQLTEDLTFDEANAIFPAPPNWILNRIVFATGWQNRLASQTSLANPAIIASMVVSGFSQGKTLQQIAQLIRPSLQGVQTSARRVARTEGMRVAHDIQMHAWQDAGDLIIGYQIHATLDGRTRPEHRRRDGTKYYKDPKPGQLSVAVMPRPPLESDGSVAHNCRCYLTPILRGLDG